MKKEIAIIFAGISLSVIHLSVFADTQTTSSDFSVPYVQKINDTTYDVHTINPSTDITQMTFKAGGSNLNVATTASSDIFRISNYQKSNFELAITKNGTQTKSGVVVARVETSKSIKIRKEDRTLFKPMAANAVIDSSKSTTTILLEKPVNLTSPDASAVLRSYAVNVNGTDYPLIIDSGEYADGKYYINNNYVVFSSTNLKNTRNVVKLKIDDAYSNYVVFDKQTYQLDNPERSILKMNGDVAQIDWTFSMPYNLRDIKNTTFYVNGSAIDKNNLVINQNQVTITYPIKNITDGQSVNIYLADARGNISNTISLDSKDFLDTTISKISLGDGTGRNFQFGIEGKDSAFIGGVMNVIVNINGQDYSFVGTRTPMLSDDGKTQLKDSYGNIKYEMKNKIDITRIASGLGFNFYYEQLKDGENIVYIKNTITGKTSNKVSFVKGKYDSINYAFGVTPPKPVAQEIMTYEKSPNTTINNMDLFSQSQSTPAIGKISFMNFDSKKTYEASFKISTNAKIIPFSSVTFNNLALEPVMESDGTVSYIYRQIGLGNVFSSSSISFNLNSLYNLTSDDIIGKPSLPSLQFTIGSFSIKKINEDQKLIEIFSSKSSATASLVYQYDFGNCFDGGSGGCKTAGLSTPVFSMSVVAGSGAYINPVPVISAPVSQTNTSTGQVTQKLAEGNVQHLNQPSDVLVIDFKSAQFKNLNVQFKNLYQNAKDKGVAGVDLFTLKKAINSILTSLRDVENGATGAAKREAKLKIKDAIIKIRGVLKK